MTRRLGLFPGVVLAISVFVYILTASLHWASFDLKAYESAFAKYGVAEDLAVELSTLMDYSTQLTSYLRGELETPNVFTTVRGVEGMLYGEREILHLIDVKDLFALSFRLRTWSLIAALASLAVIVRARLSGQAARGYLYTSAGIILGIFALAVLSAVDFNKYFTYFHHISFSNDLWLLDPETENLIRLFPEAFFAGVAMRIAAVTMLLFSLSSVLAAKVKSLL